MAAVGIDTLARVQLQHRGVGLLHLEEEGIVVRGREEQHPAQRPDAADPDHLDGGVTKFEAVQQGLVGRGQRAAVHGQRVRTTFWTSPGRCPSACRRWWGAGPLLRGCHPCAPRASGTSPRRRLLARSFSMRLMARSRALAAGPEQLVGTQRPVPQLQRLQLAELGHRLAARADAGHGHVLGHGVLQAVVPARDDELAARRLTSHSHRRRRVRSRSLIEKMIFRSGVANPPSCTDCVTAARDAPAGGRGGHQVGRHREGRPPVERERGTNHAPVAQGSNSATRPASAARTSSTASRRLAGAFQAPWGSRGQAARKALPAA